MQKSKSIINNKLFLVIMLAVTVGLSSMEFSSWKKRRAVEQEVARAEQEAKAYEEKNKNLTDSLAFLNSTSSREKIAREQLNLKRDGEIVVHFPNNLNFTYSNAEKTTPTKLGNAKKWWDYFFGNTSK